jgi:hypothetical protein
MSRKIIPMRPSISLADLADRINVEHAAAVGALVSWLDHAIKAGKLLTEAKDSLQHGQWIDWVNDHCTVSIRMAQIYMQLVKYEPLLTSAKANCISYMSIDDAIRLVREAEKDRYIERICERSPGIEPEIVRLSRGVLMQERDDERRNILYNTTDRHDHPFHADAKWRKLALQETSQVEVLARRRTEMLDRAGRLEQEAKDLRQEAAALQKQISRMLRSAFVQENP